MTHWDLEACTGTSQAHQYWSLWVPTLITVVAREIPPKIKRAY